MSKMKFFFKIFGSKNNRLLAIVIRAISTLAAGKVFVTLAFLLSS